MNEQRKDIIQDCNINFLVGSGLSSPYLRTLGSIEALLTELEDTAIPADEKQLIKASLYKAFFDGVISKNMNILQGDVAAKDVLESYKMFLQIWNSILLRRKSTILSKEVNIFTTNVDVFLDKALEELSLEYNDGFNGRFKPLFSLSNFKKSRFKKSLHYDNIAEIPVFNLLKLHGSLSWEKESDDRIMFSRDLSRVKAIADKAVSATDILDIPDKATIGTLASAAAGKALHPNTREFMQEYNGLLIVNPTKDKFKHTLLNQTYYELLRLYSNELEKENTALFVMGFSFADEHIREITLRAANSNPTLIITVIAYSGEARAEIEARFGADKIKNRNIHFIAPPKQSTTAGGPLADKFMYDLGTINKEYFGTLFQDEQEPVETDDD